MIINKDTQLVSFFCGTEAFSILHVVGPLDCEASIACVEREINYSGCQHSHMMIKATWNQLVNRRGANNHNIRVDFSLYVHFREWYYELPEYTPPPNVTLQQYKPSAKIDPTVFEEADV